MDGLKAKRMDHIGIKRYMILTVLLFEMVFFFGIKKAHSQSVHPCYGSNICKEILKGMSGGSLLDKENSRISLSKDEMTDHLINRFGYGINPLFPITDPNKAVLDLIYSMAISLEKGATAPITTPALDRLKDAYNVRTPELGVSFNPIKESFESLALKIVQIDKMSGTSEAKSKDKNYIRNRSFDYSAQYRLLHAALNSQVMVNSKLVDQQVNLNSILQEFWFNHFNVDYNKIRHLGTFGGASYEKKIFEKMHTSFADMLFTITTSPMMLVYLDNRNNRFNLNTMAASNQNLGRELMELHSFGVGPGSLYNQNDIEGSSLILTGINYVEGYDGQGKFTASTVINPALHVQDYVTISKVKKQTAPVVMGKRFCLYTSQVLNQSQNCPENTKTYTELQKRQLVLDQLARYTKFLASHPRTKQYICNKLTSKFVSGVFQKDAAGVEREVFRKDVVNRCLVAWGVEGNLPQMYKAIVSAPQTWSRQNFQRGLKNPIELVVSMARNTGLMANQLQITSSSGPDRSQTNVVSKTMLEHVTKLGLPYRKWMTPTGYKEGGWLSQGLLVRVLDTSFQLANVLEKSNTKSFAPIMGMMNQKLLGSSEDRTIKTQDPASRYNLVMQLLGNTPSRVDKSVIGSKTRNILSPVNSDQHYRQLIEGKWIDVPLKTGLILNMSSRMFLHK